MGRICGTCAFTLFIYSFKICVGQALPDLPELPSASPAVSASPLPSALADIVNPSPTEAVNLSPSPIPVPTSPPEVAPEQSPLQSSVPSTSDVASQPSGNPQPEMEISSVPSPTVSNILDTNSDQGCARDESNPKPVLGKSQLRYAASVLLSAAAIAMASVLYGLASDWHPQEVHAFYRLLWITIARILIVAAVKISAALVASITKASPDDSALDASGAFLTWGSAIFTRLYYEGFKMTLAVLEFIDNDTIWDDKLREFLSLERTSSGSSSSQETSVGPDEEGLVTSKEHGTANLSTKNFSIVRWVFGGNIERKLLLVTAVLYFASEVSVLYTNVMGLVGAFLQSANPDDVIFFARTRVLKHASVQKMFPLTFFLSPCATFFIRASSSVFVGLISVQVIYAFSQQPSLVPLLTVCAYCPKCEKYPRFNIVLRHLKWLACVVLCLWVGSLLVMPVFAAPLQPLFLAGDLSLFWYVVLAPPSYQSASYVITASFTCLAAVVGTYIIYGISIDQKTVEGTEPTANV